MKNYSPFFSYNESKKERGKRKEEAYKQTEAKLYRLDGSGVRIGGPLVVLVFPVDACSADTRAGALKKAEA